MSSVLDERDVFLNVPFDRRYERPFVALVAGLTGIGRRPRCVLEIADSGQGRLTRIIDLIRECPSSIHDLCRIGVSPTAPRVPRFNMPFELGLACATARLTNSHRFFVLEERAYRIQKSLSDLNGHDPHIHGGTVDGVLNGVLGFFGSSAGDPTFAKLRRLHDLVWERAVEIRDGHGVETLFSPAVFRQTVLMATSIARNKGLIA